MMLSAKWHNVYVIRKIGCMEVILLIIMIDSWCSRVTQREHALLMVQFHETMVWYMFRH